MESKDSGPYLGILTSAAALIIVYIAVYVLIVADHLLIPFVIAILIWYLLNTIDHMLSKIRLGEWSPPRWLRLLLAITLMALLLNMVATIVIDNVSKIIQTAPDYQSNFEALIHDLPMDIDMEDVPVLTWLTEEMDLGIFLQRLARESAALLGNVGLIGIYLVFIFLEGKYFRRKLTATFGEERQEWILKLMSRFDRDIKRYIGVKTLLSFATALGSYIIMRAVGLDFAEFWALLVFVLNFIPNLGSIAATILPSLLALLQFEQLGPFFVILFGIGALQFVIGNLLDPAMMGKSLNVSPLIIILSLVFWGFVWGLPGLFLCVPITVILMIILHSFDKTRWIALMMSRDGEFKN